MCVCIFHVDVQMFQQHLLTRLFFAPLFCLCSFVKGQLTPPTVGVYFWALCYILLIHLTHLSPTPDLDIFFKK